MIETKYESERSESAPLHTTEINRQQIKKGFINLVGMIKGLHKVANPGLTPTSEELDFWLQNKVIPIVAMLYILAAAVYKYYGHTMPEIKNDGTLDR